MPGLAMRRLLLSSALIAAFAPAAGAEELRVGLATQSVYNSNFFSSSSGENEAISLQVGPTFALDDPDGRLRYELSYTGAYQAYVDQSGVDAWESRLRGRATFDLDRRTRVRLTERFRDVSNLRFSRQDIALADTALDPNRDRYFRNELELEGIRDVSRYLQWSVRGAYHWIDFEDNVDRNDSQAFEVGSELRYRLTADHTVGVGASYVDQNFASALSRLGSRGQYVNAYLTWTWAVRDAVSFNLNGGPSWVRSNEDETDRVRQTRFVGGEQGGDLFRADIRSCDGNLASRCDFASFDPIPASDLGTREDFDLDSRDRVGTASQVTFFGGASVDATLSKWNLSSSYTRRQSTTAGDGLASSLDRVALEVEYAPPTWRFSLFAAGSFDRRETLTEATVVDFEVVAGPDGAARRDRAFTTVEDRRSRRDGYTAIAGVRTGFTRWQSGTLEFRFRRSEQRDSGVSRPAVDTFFVLLSLDYDHEPIRF